MTAHRGFKISQSADGTILIIETGDSKTAKMADAFFANNPNPTEEQSYQFYLKANRVCASEADRAYREWRLSPEE